LLEVSAVADIVLPARTRSSAVRSLSAAMIAITAAVRVYLCTQAPVETTDLVRNAAYGEAFFRYGFRVYDMLPRQLHSHHFRHFEWPTHVYDYPFTSLFFYALLTRLSHQLAVFKLVLTAMDLVSGLLLARLTRMPLMAAAYFAAPLCLWWTSVEGQTESFMALLCLLSLDSLRREHQATAFAFWGAAIQTKGLPLLLAPAFLWAKGQRVRNAGVLALSFIPSVLALMFSSYVARMFSAGYKPTWPHAFRWNPLQGRPQSISDVLFMSEAAYSYLLFALVSLGAARVAYRVLVGRSRWPRLLQYAPLWLLLFWFKHALWTQHWYFIMVPAFATLISDRRTRLALIGLSLIEPRACVNLWHLLAGGG
jgi:hypothetical protein